MADMTTFGHGIVAMGCVLCVFALLRAALTLNTSERPREGRVYNWDAICGPGRD